jgi:hypothetical protein
MRRVVLDTNVASLISQQLPAALLRELVGAQITPAKPNTVQLGTWMA